MLSRFTGYSKLLDRVGRNRIALVAVGLLFGFGMAKLWPHEPAWAVATDRNGKYALLTTPAGDDMEAVFLLDFLTGNLQGHAINARNAQFTRSYFRNIAADFELDLKAEPQWAIASGLGQLAGSRGTNWGKSVIYVSELTSGRVVAYGFPYTETQQVQEPAVLEKLNGFTWREAAR